MPQLPEAAADQLPALEPAPEPPLGQLPGTGPLAVPARPPGTGLAIPPRPTRPPAVPAPALPARVEPPLPPVGPPGPGTTSSTVALPLLPLAPAIEPMFTRAPGLNWAGPGDHWSRAWASDASRFPVAPPFPAAPPRPALPGGSAFPALPALAAVPGAPALPQPVAAVMPVAAGAGRWGAEQPPTAGDIELIRSCLAVVEPVADRATAHFYALLFLRDPEIRALFPAAMDLQRDRLFRTLLTAVRDAADPAVLAGYLAPLGRSHRKYGTLSGHYGPVGECLVAALERYCGSHWTAEAELAWRRAYGQVARVMSDAAEQAAKTSPPWWQAEIVAHRLSTPDIAVLTLRPDQAYPYRAGQYTALETPWWPRVWRHYSFAAAPRPDGLLTIHVKAVQAGWVSNALVRRAAPGDVLRLGPAEGGMVLDHADGADLLCVGGGTGIAPVTALVEELAAHGTRGRSVEVFYGARRHTELYGLDALRRLARGNPWITVRPVLSQESGGAGAESGELPDAIARRGPWSGHAAYLSGPPAMVRRTAAALRRSGVLAERIHHDLPGEPAAR
ncbi:globin domain-containing protein [Kitasatospora sp. NPDC001175]|uniref:globin domain-containing protein n=1 Tax=Kitasatospora sp. NPDC001175 TaxID=3157103 RepID=UPI003D00E444